jgi:hypothetical protein
MRKLGLHTSITFIMALLFTLQIIISVTTASAVTRKNSVEMMGTSLKGVKRFDVV